MDFNYVVSAFIVFPAPPEFDSPTYYRVVSETKLLIVLYPASPENGDITHYFVVVVPDDLTHGRRPQDFKLDEVFFSIASSSDSIVYVYKTYAPSKMNWWCHATNCPARMNWRAFSVAEVWNSLADYLRRAGPWTQ